MIQRIRKIQNPDDPENPEDNNHEDGTQGPLSIDYVSNFHFGKHNISGSDQVYYAKLDTVKAKVEIKKYQTSYK